VPYILLIHGEMEALARELVRFETLLKVTVVLVISKVQPSIAAAHATASSMHHHFGDSMDSKLYL